MGGMFVAFFLILDSLPNDINFSKAMKIAGANDKLQILDFTFDASSRYTMWSGLTGGFFLALSYFGTDQSQVQRYLSGKSIRESQLGLVFNGLLKVPMQFFILLVGVMVFVYYQFNHAPLNFNPVAVEAVQNSAYASQYSAVETKYEELEKEKKIAQEKYATALDHNDLYAINDTKEQIRILNTKDLVLRQEAKNWIEKADSNLETNDKDYVFIHFILNKLPKGLIGLLLAVILSAAMSSTASELNALGTITAIDLYKRNRKDDKEDNHFLRASKFFTLSWGIIAIGIACVADLFDNLIQLVNIIGSIFYGNVLGVFLLAFFFKWIRGNAVFYAAVLTQIAVVVVYYLDWMTYLWLNAFGCAVVILLAMILQGIFGKRKPIAQTT